jgi:redox-sensitive bicupin YhaK (pirin superfamily)
LDWLRAKHHFRVKSSGNPAHHSIRALIVWNDDEISPGCGFDMHEHRNVEIVTYVRQGVLGHRDTLGSEGAIQAGDVQTMSAGSGIRHAEYNLSDVPLRLYQIWFIPRESGGQPRWHTKRFPKNERSGGFVALASGYAADKGALPIRADARLLGAALKAGEHLTHEIDFSCEAYLVVAAGRIEINGEPMGPLDGVAITELSRVGIAALEDSELVLVETGKDTLSTST